MEPFGFLDGETPPRVTAHLVLMHYANGSPRAAPMWVIDSGSNCWVGVGGYADEWTKGPLDEILDTAEVVHGAWESLEWRNTSLLSPSSSSGWLAPDGTWFGCLGYQHDLVARLAFRCTGGELEQTHARVHCKGHALPPQTAGVFTASQVAWLTSHGHTVADTAEAEKRELARWEAWGPRRRRTRDGD